AKSGLVGISGIFTSALDVQDVVDDLQHGCLLLRNVVIGVFLDSLYFQGFNSTSPAVWGQDAQRRPHITDIILKRESSVLQSLDVHFDLTPKTFCLGPGKGIGARRADLEISQNST
ncbi:MAG: hypothetical protein ACR2QC_04295, partial [Gammaproteobacteria bacterium]